MRRLPILTSGSVSSYQQMAHAVVSQSLSWNTHTQTLTALQQLYSSSCCYLQGLLLAAARNSGSGALTLELVDSTARQSVSILAIYATDTTRTYPCAAYIPSSTGSLDAADLSVNNRDAAALVAARPRSRSRRAASKKDMHPTAELDHVQLFDELAACIHLEYNNHHLHLSYIRKPNSRNC